MSTLQVANVHLEPTGNNRIQFSGTNNFTMYTSGIITVSVSNTAFTVNTNAFTAANSVSDGIGNVRDIVNTPKFSAYVPTAADNGKMINITTGGITINTGVFSNGQNITVYNNSGASQTITQGSGVTLRLAGTATTGNRTLAQRGIATIVCVSLDEYVTSGTGLT